MLTLKLGDVVPLGGQLYVVATITGLPPNVWTLVRVPTDKEPLDLGTTWTRSETESLTLFAPPQPPVSVSLEPPMVPVRING